MSKIDFEYCGRSNAGETGVIAAAISAAIRSCTKD
jgi:hypothetical protein